MKVFLAGTSFHASYGGPAYSVSRLAAALAAAGIEVGLWAPDGSALDSPLIVEAASVRRLAGEAAAALDEFGGAVVIHDNGIWLGHNHQLARLASATGIPRVVSSRGMLEPWAMNHKRWKKYLAWQLYQRRDLKIAAALHATAESEAAQLRKLGLTAPVVVIPNGVDVPEAPDVECWMLNDELNAREYEAAPKSEISSIQNSKFKIQNQQRTALFLGRIHSIKGLPMLIEAWAKVRPQGWRLRIVGPDEDGHVAELQRLCERVGLEWEAEEAGVGSQRSEAIGRNLESSNIQNSTSRILFSGPVDGKEKWQAFREADLFILPTHSENFGIAVAEALASGVPVITTQGAPWKGLLSHGCGWWTEVSTAGIAAALQETCETDAATLQAMGQRGREWMVKDFGWDGIARKMIAAYEEVLRIKR